jgi:hypothetical protein
MRRRHFLTIAGVAAIAGCAGSGDENENPGAEKTSDDTERNQETNSEQNQEEADNRQETDDTQNDESQQQEEGEPELTVTDIRPDSLEIGEKVTVEMTFENQGDGAGSSEITIYGATTNGSMPGSGDWGEPVASPTVHGIDPGEQDTYTVFTNDPMSRPGVVFYGIGEREVDYKIEIPESKAPILTDASLVSSWESFGDLQENGTGQVEVGESIKIASQYWYWQDQRVDVLRTVRLLDENEDQVRLRTSSGKQLVEDVGWTPFRVADVFDTTGLDPGEYTAEILIEDRDSGLVSDTFETTFTLIDNETAQ